MKMTESNREKYEAAGSAPFKLWNDKPMVMSFGELPADIFKDQDMLMEWSAESLAIQLKG